MICAQLVINLREQPGHAYDFAGCSSKHIDFTLERRGLPTGDYLATLVDETEPSDACVVERKSFGDLFGSLNHHRDCFLRERE